MAKTIDILKKIGNVASIILLGETKDKIIRTEEAVGRIDKDIKELKNDCKKIWGTIISHAEDITGLKVHTAYGKNASPTNPNELGEQLLQQSGFYEIYPQIKNDIFRLMDSANLRTLYDYEKGAEKILFQLKDNPLMDKIKDYSVNNPSEPLELIFKVASWIIRDDYNQYKKD